MLALLEKAEASVHLDGRRPGVVLPSHLLGEPHVRLDYGYGLSPAIPDLQIGDGGVTATLSFSPAPFKTFVPWSAVYLIADFDGNGAVWQEDIPGDMLDGIAEREPPDDAAAPAPADPTALSSWSDPSQKSPPGKPRPSHLKLVK